MVSLPHLPKDYKREFGAAESGFAGGGASGGPGGAPEDVSWLLLSREEDPEAWIRRVSERLNPLAKHGSTRSAWAKALFAAQGWARRAEGLWAKVVDAWDDGVQDRGALENNLRAAGSTVRAFPHVCAAALGLSPAVVWEVAGGGSSEPNPPGFDASAAANLLGFWFFVTHRNRSDAVQAVQAEMERRRGACQLRREPQGLEGTACQVLSSIGEDGHRSTGLERATCQVLSSMGGDDPRLMNLEGTACQVLSSISGGDQGSPELEESPCQLLSSIARGGPAAVGPEVTALSRYERAAAEAVASLIRASRAARGADPEAADAALLRTAGLLQEYLAEWEVARLLAAAEERRASAEIEASEMIERAEAEAASIVREARAEAEAAKRLAARAATEAVGTAAWRELRREIDNLLYNRYRLHLPAQEDGLDGYRETVRAVKLARKAIPMVADAAMARLLGRCGDLKAAIWSDFGACEVAKIDVRALVAMAEDMAATIPEMGVAPEFEGLADELAALDYPQAAPGLVPVAELLAAQAGANGEEVREAVAAARSGRGRPVIPVVA